MKNLFWAFFAVCALSVNAWPGEIAPPKVPDAVGWEVRETNIACGDKLIKLVQKQYVSKAQGVRWFINYLGSDKNPLSVTKKTSSSYEAWLDRDRDGIVDEYFTIRGLLYAKYPSPCDAIQ